MRINPYLNFNGQCEEAFTFYARVLGGRIERLTRFEGSPMADHVPPERRQKVMHAMMTIGDQVLMASDLPPDRYSAPSGFAVSLLIDDFAGAEAVFRALGEGGLVQMEFQKTFWARGFGHVVDRFGIPWLVNCE